MRTTPFGLQISLKNRDGSHLFYFDTLELRKEAIREFMDDSRTWWEFVDIDGQQIVKEDEIVSILSFSEKPQEQTNLTKAIGFIQDADYENFGFAESRR